MLPRYPGHKTRDALGYSRTVAIGHAAQRRQM